GVRCHRANSERGVQRLALPASAIGREGWAPRADVFGAATALKALAAGYGPVQEYRIARPHMIDASATGEHAARTFMAHQLGEAAIQHIQVRVADTACLDLNQDFVCLGGAEFDRFGVEQTVSAGYQGSRAQGHGNIQTAPETIRFCPTNILDMSRRYARGQGS